MDNELKGEGNSLNYTFRMHDPRVGRFFAIDPLTKKYPHYSPYSFSGNRVIDAIELEGLEEILIFKAQKENDKNYKQALKILASSGLMKEIVNKFASNNRATDIYISIGDLGGDRGNTQLMETENVITGKYQKNNKQDKLTFGNRIIGKIGALEYEDATKKAFAVLKTFDEGKVPILINIERNRTPEQIALTLYHEIVIHALDEKDKKDDVTESKEHMDFYDDPKFYSLHPSGHESPDYEDINPNSDAGKIKAIIEKTSKQIKKTSK